MSKRVNSPDSKQSSKPRGRPRNEKARRSILNAAQELLAEGGLGAVTMEGVAARAKVGKPTLYRWWADRHAVAMAALMEGESEEAPASKSRSSILALRQQLRGIAKRFANPLGRHVASLIASSDMDSELSKAFRNHFVLARRSEGRALMEQAMRDGEIRRDIDVDVALDLLYGPIFFRLLMGHAALDERFTTQVLEHALRGFRQSTDE